MLDILYFILGVLFGGVILTLYNDKPSVIIKHPTPFNTNSTTYVGSTGDCYKYRVQEAECNDTPDEIPIHV